MKRSKRILFISQTALGTSTTNRYMSLLSVVAENEDFNVTLFFLGKGKEASDKSIGYPKKIGRIRIVHSPAIPAMLLKKQSAIFSALTALWLLITGLPALVRQMTIHDLVNLGKPQPLGGFMVMAARFFVRRPLVLDLDDWEGVGGFATVKQKNNAFAKAIITYFEEWLPAKCAAVVVVSRLLEKRITLCGIPSDRIHIIPNGADILKYSPGCEGLEIKEKCGFKQTDIVLAYLGTFKPGGASWQLILDVFAVTYKRHADARLMMIGWGVDIDDAKTYAKKQNLSNAICFTGKVNHDQIPQYLAAADVYILPYSIDFPDTYINIGRSSLKLYEYMAMGRPIIASDIGEISVALSDGCGELVPINDPEYFGGKIADLLDNPSKMAEFGRNARARAEDTYNYTVLGKRLVDVYNSILFR